MRSLIVTLIALVPTNEGNRVRIRTMITVLQDLWHDVWIVGLGLLDASAMKMASLSGPKGCHIDLIAIPKER
jgi:hypothetical protein